jgi:adenylate kinase family enzyme
MLGQPISNELNTKILIEYLKEIGDVKGWALINYPNTYEQMTMLEKALIDSGVPPECKTTNFTDISIEDIDPSPPRIIFEDDEKDRLAACRRVLLFHVEIV